MQASGTHVDLYLFGVIGDWWDGTTANEVLSYLTQNPDAAVNVFISSVGGYFEDGLPIFNLLRMHKGEVTVNIIGYCLSMASHIMLAANKIRIAQNGQIMTHNAQGVARGDYRDMEKAATMLRVHNDSIIPEYQRRTGKTADEVKAMLDAETWFTANTALAAGLVDEIIDPVDIADVDKLQTENAWKFAIQNFHNAPPDFTARAEQLAHGSSWLMRILNRVVGNPPANLPPPDNISEADMTPEELKAALAAERAEYAKMLDEKLAALKPAVETPDAPAAQSDDAGTSAALTAKLEKAEADAAKNAADAAKLAELMQDVPGTVPPPVTGPAGRHAKRFS